MSQAVRSAVTPIGRRGRSAGAAPAAVSLQQNEDVSSLSSAPISKTTGSKKAVILDGHDDDLEKAAGFLTVTSAEHEGLKPIVYGVKNCSQVRDVFKKFDREGVEYLIYDYKKTIPSARLLRRLIAALGLDVVINHRSPTWKNQSVERREVIFKDEDIALEFMQKNVTVIKRPIVFIPSAKEKGLSFDYIVGDDDKLIKQVLDVLKE